MLHSCIISTYGDHSDQHQADHMDTFGGDFENLKQTFIDFRIICHFMVRRSCVDDPVIRELIPQVSRQVLLMVFLKMPTFVLRTIANKANKVKFTVVL